MNEEQNKSIDNKSSCSSSTSMQQTIPLDNSQSLSKNQTIENNSNDEINSSDRSRIPEEIGENHRHTDLETKSEVTIPDKNQTSNMSNHTHYQDIPFGEKNISYYSFSTTNKESTESKPVANKKLESIQLHPIQQLLNQNSTVTIDDDSNEDEKPKKLAAAKKLLFPDALATSFSEIADTLRSERRQEFSPIYQDETPEQIALRQSNQKPVGSLLAKRIRWDELKRKREEEKERKAQRAFRYGPYGPIYTNPYSQQTFANPYEQYYAAMQNQYEQMIRMNRVQQEHSGFWSDCRQQSTVQNNDRIAQNSMQQQIQPYTYPYATMYSNNMNDANTSFSSTNKPTNHNLYFDNVTRLLPPPPPPDEPYPY